tara:strand:+ start:564 stop:1349 length:786 start_codon:yes stop_codon:yes gene_type:complete
MDYRIAIPTIARAKTIREKTIGYFLRTDVDLSKIDIFFSDPSEIDEYKKVLGDLPIKNYIPTNQKHIRLQRNFIAKYYPENTFVVGIDDDIQSLQTKINDKKTVELTQFNDFVINAFNVSQANKSDIWGVSAVLNPFFMKNAVSFSLKYIVACFYGWRNTHLPKNLLSTEKGVDGQLYGKEDYEKSIQYYIADGKVTRFNYVAPKTKYYSEDGGIQVYRTLENERLGVEYLLRTYPSFCRRKKTKEGKYAEVRLRDFRKKK